MTSRIFLEGGGNSKELKIRCRTGFRKLLESCGFTGRLPELVASGSREEAFRRFKIDLSQIGRRDFVALLIDSEEPVEDIDQTWQHLSKGDGWVRPQGSDDDQVFLMTTCTETWIVCDVETLRRHFGSGFQESALPALQNLERRPRAEVLKNLEHASRNCPGPYSKGARSFEILAKLRPEILASHLPSFARMRRILDQKLG